MAGTGQDASGEEERQWTESTEPRRSERHLKVTPDSANKCKAAGKYIDPRSERAEVNRGMGVRKQRRGLTVRTGRQPPDAPERGQGGRARNVTGPANQGV